MLHSTNKPAAPPDALAENDREARELALLIVTRALARLARRDGPVVEMRALSSEVVGVGCVSLRRLHKTLFHLERTGRVELLPRRSDAPVPLGDAAVAVVDGRRGLLALVRVIP